MSGASDRQVIEEYLKLYCIEEILDETINDIIERRPNNPYVEMSKLIEAKTMPEIMEVTLHPVIGACNTCAVEAVVMTNLGPFKGQCAFPFDGESTLPTMMDFSFAQVKVDDALKNLDPRKMDKVDGLLRAIVGLDPPVIMAVSIACARAGCRHRGVPLFRYIADLAQSEPQIPLPVPAVLSRSVGNPSAKHTQTVHIYPTISSSLESAMETVLQASSRINEALLRDHVPLTVSSIGCAQTASATTEEALRYVVSAVDDGDDVIHVKPAVDYRGGTLVQRADDVDIAYTYNGVEEGVPAVSATDVVESIVAQWKEYEMCSIEDPLHVQDITHLRLLKSRITETVDTLREDGGARELKYALSGVGGDDACVLQVVADCACKTADEMRLMANEAIFDAIKVRFDKMASLTNAIELCRTARELGWAVIIACAEDGPETTDTFISDFAVGVGAAQFMAGGLHSSETGAKYNRLLEISRENETITFIGSKFRR